jgi:hypothetical protein
MAVDISMLSQRILNLQNKLVRNDNAKVIAASKAFLTEVVNATPVDTGQAVSSWKTGFNYVPRGTRNLAPGSKGSSASAARSAVLALELPRLDGRKTGYTVYIVNTTDYISALNAGRSKQAPAGFLDRARLASGAASRKVRLLD